MIIIRTRRRRITVIDEEQDPGDHVILTVR
jgi:hypothetical protein